MDKVRAVAGILQNQNKILVAERPKGKPYANYWEFPGGKIEKNEMPQVALKRELYEELGIEVINSQFLFKHCYNYPDKHVELEVWLITAYKGQPSSKENQALRWVSFTEMKELKLLEGNWSILEKLELSYQLSSQKL